MVVVRSSGAGFFVQKLVKRVTDELGCYLGLGAEMKLKPVWVWWRTYQ